jgi:hypothetical protein
MGEHKTKIPESKEVKEMDAKQTELAAGALSLLSELFRNIVCGNLKVDDLIRHGKTENGKDKELYTVNYMNSSAKWNARLQLAFVFEEKKIIL